MTIAGRAVDVFVEVALERNSQDHRWGEQNHPLVPREKNGNDGYHRMEHSRRANMWKALNDQRVAYKRLAWDGILLEEVFEAFAEKDPDKARAEMIQVAAVAIAIIESIDRNKVT